MTFAKLFAILQIMKSPEQQKEIRLLMERAAQMLIVADRNLAERFYESSVNRSYYAVFYAASALLTTKQIAMKRHADCLTSFTAIQFASFTPYCFCGNLARDDKSAAFLLQKCLSGGHSSISA